MNIITWLITGIALFLSIFGWGQDLNWKLFSYSLYEWFPLFGLIAFSIMWSHYAVDFVNRFKKIKISKSYIDVTHWAVLIALLTHPGLFAWKRFSDGFGLPLGSFFSYVGSGLVWAVIVGFSAWLAFLGFELHRWFRKKTWFRWIALANAFAMIGVVIHVIYLACPVGWFLYLWYFYGVSLLIFISKEYYDYFTKIHSQS